MTAAERRLEAVVVGGGQAGLAMAWHLRRLGLRFLVVDAGPEAGHGWRSRWDSLRLFTPARHDGLPGRAFPGRAGSYPGKDDVADYLRDYADAFDLPVRHDTRVTRLARHGEGYALHTAGERLLARQVIVATGPFQAPFIPAMAGELGPAVTQLHSVHYRGPAQLPDGPVVVVGGGNSGRQIAIELAADRPVELSIGTSQPVVPQRVLGRDLFWWLTRLGVLGASADSRLGRRMRARGELVVGTSDRMLRRAGVTLRPRLTGTDTTTVRFADASTTAPRSVVWATGFRPDYSWIDVDGVLAGERPVHRRGVTATPGLYFLGLPWQHTRGSALLGFVADDAAHLADRIATLAAAPGPAGPVDPRPVPSSLANTEL